MAYGREQEQPESGPEGGLAAVGVAAFLVACCGAAPLLVVLVGSLTIGALAGIGAGVLALAALVGVVVFLRRRRACEAPAPAATRAGADGASRVARSPTEGAR